jgi:hypothetical protein
MIVLVSLSVGTSFVSLPLLKLQKLNLLNYSIVIQESIMQCIMCYYFGNDTP